MSKESLTIKIKSNGRAVRPGKLTDKQIDDVVRELRRIQACNIYTRQHKPRRLTFRQKLRRFFRNLRAELKGNRREPRIIRPQTAPEPNIVYLLEG